MNTPESRPDPLSAPLLERLLAADSGAALGFHMPGHAAGRAWPPELAARLASLDSTETPLTDDLNAPGEALEAACRLAAEAWGAGRSWLLAGGSTLGIRTAILAAVGRHGTIAIERGAHQAALQTVSLLHLPFRLLPQPAAAADWQRPLPAAVDPGRLDALLRQDPGIRAVLVTSPDYYGRIAPTQQLAAVCHRHDCLLLVDAAHGAHFAFVPGLRAHCALRQGADLVIQSAHKTLPALTGAALLHVSREALASGRVRTSAVNAALSLWQGSSPSLLIAATADWARAWMAVHAPARAAELISAWSALAERLAARRAAAPVAGPIRLSRPASDRDPLRFLIGCTEAGDADRLAAALLRRGIAIEFHDHRRLVLLPSFAHGAGEIRQLGDALAELTAGPADGEDAACLVAGDRAWSGLLGREGDFACHPAELFDIPRRLLPPAACAGAVLAAAVRPYPPGIPLLWPGERLDAAALRDLAVLVESGAVEGRLALVETAPEEPRRRV
ncbi:MAG: aminotransferase class V-fold PLP-dependent enzyme [Bacillota bacterium]|nr:aminotransferase class V-fold PLP-dependent enzyme [Bacillota bacterium]